MADSRRYQLRLEDVPQIADRVEIEMSTREARNGDPKAFVEWQWGTHRDKEGQLVEGVVLDDFQWDVLNHVFSRDHTEVFIKGCTKPGKGFVVAMAVNIWFDIYPMSKIVLTGPSSDHVKDNLFAEVVALRRRMATPGPGEIMAAMIKDHAAKKPHHIIIANPKSGEGFSGQHSPHTLFVVDEASGAEDWMYENAKKQAMCLIALSNPRTLSGWFRKGFGVGDINVTRSINTERGKRRLVTVGGDICRNVREKRLERPIAPKDGIEIKGKKFAQGDYIPDEFYKYVKPVIVSQLDYARFQEIMASPDPFVRKVFGMGHFPDEDVDNQVILQSWLVEHIQAWHNLHNGDDIDVTAFGLDVAASEHGDETCLAPGGPAGCRRLHTVQKSNVMLTTGWVLDEALARYGVDLKVGAVPVAVDYGGGYGRGVGDRLREQGVMVIPVHPNKRSRFPNLYENIRAECYGELGRRLNPRGPWVQQDKQEGDDPNDINWQATPWAIPDDSNLHADLCAPEKIRASDGIRFRLIPKSKPHKDYTGTTIEEKLGRSPDKGDAVALLHYALRRQEAIPDFSHRPLVISLEQPVVEVKDENPMEALIRERDERIAELCRQMDADKETDWFAGIG